MAKRSWANENLDQFAAAIRRMAERVGKLDEFGKEDHPNALRQIALIAGTAFLEVAQEHSPYYTGTLHDAHIMSPVELSRVSGGMQAEVRIFINPDPSIINPVFGGFPGQYGPEYHRERRQWFAEAEQIVEPMFDKIMDKQMSLVFEGFWS